MKLFLNLILLNLVIPLLCLNRGIFKSELKNKPKSIILLDTNLGTIIGYKQDVNIPNVVNKTINVFYGVPFSDGKTKRFKKAKLISEFPNKIYSALTFKPHCPRVPSSKYHEQDELNEDCLRLNIWTPDIQKINGICTKKYDVIITIVGQESIFIMSPFPDHNGDGLISYNPELLTSIHDTIVVFVSNRQGIFNSLYLDGEYGGNLMLFDQNLGIQWVKKNIKDYCGNDKITLTGNSFSSRSVQAHLISSKYSKYLVDHAILQSGSLFQTNTRLVNRNELMINSMLAINQLGCLNRKLKNDSHLELLDKKIIDKYFYFNSELKIDNYLNDLNLYWNKIESIKYKSRLDNDLIKITRFLSRNAVNLECLEDVEMNKILEINPKYASIKWYMYDDDDDFFDKDVYLNYKLFGELNISSNISILNGGIIDEKCELGLNLKDVYRDRFNIILSKSEAKKFIKNSFKDSFKEDKSEIADYLANYYTDLSKHEFRRGFYDAISNYVNDLTYNCPLYFHSEFYSKKSKNLFNYIIDYNFVNHFITAVNNHSMNEYQWIYACHADEILYLDSYPFRMPDFFTDLDREFSLKLIDLWASFARDGKMPNLEPDNKKWPSSNKNDNQPKFVQITGSFTREHKFDFEKRCNDIWRMVNNFTK